MSPLRKSKWVAGASPDSPVGETVRRAMEGRLNLVWHYLPLAANYADEEIEYVHQLRVASRRGVAAIDLFGAMLPDRRRKKMRRSLRQIRRAAGPARDLDVLSERLSTETKGDNTADLAELQRSLSIQRSDAQRAIVLVLDKMNEKDLPRRICQLIARTRWRGSAPEPDFSAFVRVALLPIWTRFQEAHGVNLESTEYLHRLRIVGKQLRYAMELVAGAFPSDFREDLYPTVEQLQQRLGSINDHASASQHFHEWFATSGGPKKDLLEHLAATGDAAAVEQADAFRQWWLGARHEDFQRRFSEIVGW